MVDNSGRTDKPPLASMQLDGKHVMIIVVFCEVGNMSMKDNQRASDHPMSMNSVSLASLYVIILSRLHPRQSLKCCISLLAINDMAKVTRSQGGCEHLRIPPNRPHRINTNSSSRNMQRDPQIDVVVHPQKGRRGEDHAQPACTSWKVDI